MRPSSVLLLSLVHCAVFATSPATHNPLQAQLAAADTSTIEDATRTCLDKSGWKVDPVGGEAAGANVVGAFTKTRRTDVYIQPPETSPRITGGPDYRDPFWKCLSGELSSIKVEPAPASSAE